MKKENKLLAAAILDIIQSWSVDMIWHGYNSIFDSIKELGFDNIKMSDLKREVKNLRQCGAIERHPLFNEDTGLICGSGYFACR